MTGAVEQDGTGGTAYGRAARAVQLAAILAVGALAYSNTFHAPFVFDDETSIVRNPVIRDLSRFIAGAGYAYNPRRFVGYLTLALNHRLGGLDVVGYHVFNLAVHLASACLVYALVRVTLRAPFFRRSGWAAAGGDARSRLAGTYLPLVAALLFVAHPVQTQAVTYVVQRLASLATMLFLASLVCYAEARLAAAPPPGEQRGRAARSGALLAASVGFAVLAMKTKELAATLPAVVVLYELLFFDGRAARRLRFLLPLLATAAIVPVSMLQLGKPPGELLSDLDETARASILISRGDYLRTQLRVVVAYVRLLLLPVDQNLDHDHPVYESFLHPAVLSSAAALVALLALAVHLLRRSARSPGSPTSALARLAAFGILWFFVTLSVESSVIPIADTMFEHRLYLPSVGAFVAAGAALVPLGARLPPRAAGALLAAAIVLLAGAAWRRNEVWGDALRLWEDSVRKSPAKLRPRYNLANELARRGRREEAVAQYRIALRISPCFAWGWNNMAVVHLDMGETAKAIEQLEEALACKPDFANAHYNLGDAFRDSGDAPRAIEHYRRAIAAKPDYSEAHNSLGVEYAKAEDMALAVHHFEEALRHDPGNGSARNNLARAIGARGR